jgi:hypothetical protein
VLLEEPVPMGSTSFSLIDDNRNEGPLPKRLYCTLWVRYDGQCYPALFPTIINEPPRASSTPQLHSSSANPPRPSSLLSGPWPAA